MSNNSPTCVEGLESALDGWIKTYAENYHWSIEQREIEKWRIKAEIATDAAWERNR